MKTYKRKSVLLRCLSVLISIAIITGVLSLIQVSAGAEAEPDIWDGTVATGFESGTGTEDDPYIIKTPEQLAYLASTVNSGTTYENACIKLANDIYLNNTDNWENWGTTAPENRWIPIGKPLTQIDELGYSSIMKIEYTFMGTFDGKNHAVYGVYTSGNEDYQGLFGFINYGIVQNLNIEKSYICGNKFVGGITGASFAAFINNCRNNGIVSGKDTYAGGISGYSCFICLLKIPVESWNKWASHSHCISNCSNTGCVTGSSSVGGICGTSYNYADVSNCFNSGHVTGNTIVGGICGSSQNESNIEYCHNTGNVSGNDSYIGGIAGTAGGSQTVVDCCSNEGTVTGNDYVGGIVGTFGGFDTTLCSCYNTGKVSASGSGVGGICGDHSELSVIAYCYNTGDITGNGSCVGGVCGTNKEHGRIKTSYNTGTVKGTCKVGGVCGYNENNTFSTAIVNCYYLNACASDSKGTVQYGNGNEQVGSSAVDVSGCTTGLSESQMMSENSFAGFDFEKVWKMPDSNAAYKYPVLQSVAPDTGDSATVFVIVALVSLFGIGIVIRSRRDY